MELCSTEFGVAKVKRGVKRVNIPVAKTKFVNKCFIILLQVNRRLIERKSESNKIFSILSNFLSKKRNK